MKCSLTTAPISPSIPKPGAAAHFPAWKPRLQPGGFAARLKACSPIPPALSRATVSLKSILPSPKNFSSWKSAASRRKSWPPPATPSNWSSISTAPGRILRTIFHANTFRLGCTPVINLFRKKCEPIDLTHDASEYRIVPSANRPTSFEIYSIESVVATSSKGQVVPYEEFYASRHSLAASKP